MVNGKCFAGCRQLTSSSRRIVKKMIPTRYKHRRHARQTPFDIHGWTNDASRGDSFFVPGFGSVTFFHFAKAQQPPRQHLHQSLCPKSPRNVLNRWRYKLIVNWNSAKSNSFISRRSHLPRWLLSTTFFFFFPRMCMFQRGHELPRHTSGFFQLVIFPTNERFPYRVA